MTRSTPEQRRRRRRRRWLLALAIPLVLLALVFALRRELFGGLVRGLIRDELSRLCGTEVALEPIDGNWWSRFELRGLGFEGAAIPLRSLTGARLTIEVDPWKLSDGAAAVLRRVEVVASEARLELPQGQGGTADTEGPDLEAALAPLADWLPDGAELRIERFTFGSSVGPLHLRLLPRIPAAGPERRLELSSPRLDLDLTLRTAPPAQPAPAAAPAFAVSVRGELRRVGSLLQDFGTDLGLSEGTGEVSADLDARGRASGSLTLVGLRYRDRVLDRTTLRFTADPERLDIPELRSELPGLVIEASDLRIPVAGTGEPIESGPLRVQIQDLAPYSEWLPGLVRERLPIRGSFRGRLADGRLELAEASLEARGAEATLAAGSLPLSRSEGRLEGSLDGRLILAEPLLLTLGPLGDCRVSGSFEGRVRGSLDEPRFEGRLAARLAARRGALLVEGALHERGGQAVEELSIRSEGEGLPGLTLDGGLELSAGELGFSLRGDLDLALLETLGLGPTLPLPLAAKGIEAEGRLRFSGPTLHGELGVAELRTGERPLGRLEAALDWRGGDLLELDRFELVPADTGQDEPTRIQAHGRLALGPQAEHDFGLETEALPLALLRPWLDPGLPDGSLDLSVTLSGTGIEPRLRAEAGLRVESAWEPLERDWPARQLGPPPGAPYVCDLVVASGRDVLTVERLSLVSGEDERRFSLEGRGTLPLGSATVPAQDCSFDGRVRLAGTGETVYAVGAKLVVRTDRVALEELELTTPQGRARGSFEARGAIPAILTGAAAADGLALGGGLTLEELPLADLPPTWLGLRGLEGRLSGSLELAGVLSHPQPRARLRLQQVACLVEGIPKLESIDGELVVEETRASIEGLSGQLGGGPFTLSGSLTAPGPLWTQLGEAGVEARFEGSDLLLFRGRGLIAIGGADLELGGRVGELLLAGTAQIDAARYSRHHSLVAFQTGARGGGAVAGFSPFHVPGALGRGLRFDVGLTTMKPVEVRGGVVDCELNATLRLQGTGDRPYFLGTIRSGKGVVRLPGANLRLASALITFEDRNPFDPDLEIQCALRRKGYGIRARVTGTYLRPALQLESNPVLEYDEILVFLMTGQLPKDLQGNALEGAATTAGVYAMSELWAWLNDSGDIEDGEEGFFERFSISSGHDFGDRGTESLLIEYKMDTNWYLQVEQEADGFYNLGLVYRISF